MRIQHLSFIRTLFAVLALSGLLIGCATNNNTCRDAEEASFSAHNYENHRTSELAIQAMSIIDTRYKYGGNTPESGLDCSGFVRYVYKKAWGAELPRTSAAISEMGESVSSRQLIPGDLVFYNTRRRPNSHVGIYVGNNQFVHAPSTGGRVRLDSMSAKYWQARFNGARRLADPKREQSETEQILQAFRKGANTL